MPYALEILNVAVEDFKEILDSVPRSRWDAIIDIVDQKLQDFVALPTAMRPPETTIPLFFSVEGVTYRWQAVWRYNPDEQAIEVYGFGRDPTAIL